MKTITEQLPSLFPEEKKAAKIIRRRRPETTYEEFIKKFEPKKTTDDCYTPQYVYDAVIEWLSKRVDLTGKEIVRPFWPGGDYENYNYPDNAVVIDNPPFSIWSKIIAFYLSHGIRFFLFGPHLTLFTKYPICHIVCGASITYENGAIVNTSFVTNLFPNVRVWVCKSLLQAIEAVTVKCPKKKIRKLSLPKNVITAARLGKALNAGKEAVILADECQFTRTFGGTQLFGGGFLINNHASAQIDTSIDTSNEDVAETLVATAKE